MYKVYKLWEVNNIILDWNTKVNIWNVLTMAGNFNIRDSNWDLFYPFYSFHSDTLLKIVNSFNLKLSCPNQQIPTHYSNNSKNSNSVINLFFLWPNLIKINNHSVLPELWYLSDHASLIVDISIVKEFIQDKKHIITKNSEEEEKFTFSFIKWFRSIMSRSLMVDFIFIFSFHFILFFLFLFLFFSIFRTTWVRVYQSCCHISHKLMA